MMCKPKNKYIRKQKYNKKYAGKHTKRELNKRINKSLICIAIVVIIIPIQLFLNTTNKIEIQKFEQEELPPSLEFKPLAVKIEPQEIKEIVVKKPVIQSDNYQYVIDYITEQSTAKGLDSDFGLNNNVVSLVEKWSGYYGYYDIIKAKAIISCEGSNDAGVCNHRFGCNGGQGHFQWIPSSWNSICVKELGLTNVFDSSQNIQCGIYTLQKYGDSHWGSLDSWWGSKRCWYPKL